MRAEPVQGADHRGDLAVEYTARLRFDEGAGGVTALGMEQVRGLPQVAEGVEQIVSAAVKMEQIGRFETGAKKKSAARANSAAPGTGAGQDSI